MTVYVDDMHTTPLGQFGRMKMCHMIADTSAELYAMAERIGVNVKWVQYSGTAREHFDICTSKRAKAVAFGAVEITMRETAMKVRDRRSASRGDLAVRHDA